MNYHNIKTFESFENGYSVQDLLDNNLIHRFRIGGFGISSLSKNSTKNLKAINLLNFYDMMLVSLKGIELFPNLKSLNLTTNRLKDLSGIECLTKLERLQCSENQIDSYKYIAMLKELEDLKITDNYLTNLKGIENQTKLRVLNVDNNQLVTLHGIENLHLSELYCGGNKLPHNNYLNFQEETGQATLIQQHLLENPYTSSQKISIFNSKTGIMD
jgi:hypothetical protein